VRAGGCISSAGATTVVKIMRYLFAIRCPCPLGLHDYHQYSNYDLWYHLYYSMIKIPSVSLDEVMISLKWKSSFAAVFAFLAFVKKSKNEMISEKMYSLELPTKIDD